MTPQLQQAIRLLQLPILELQTPDPAGAREQRDARGRGSRGARRDARQRPRRGRARQRRRPRGVRRARARGRPRGRGCGRERRRIGKTCRRRARPSAPKSSERRRRSSTRTAPRRRCATICSGSSSSRTWTRATTRDRRRRSSMPINDDGYLTDDLDTIRATSRPTSSSPSRKSSRCSSSSCSSSIPPASAHATSASASLLQLAQLAPDTPGLALARTIATEHLPLIAERQFGQLKRLLKRVRRRARVRARARALRCHPRPGPRCSRRPSEYIVPDVFVRRSDGQLDRRAEQRRLAATAGESELCGLARPGRRSMHCAAHATAGGALADTQPGDPQRDAAQGRAHDRATAERLPRARRRAHAADDPAATSRRPSRCTNRPISRVTTNKYMHTPRGVFEFRYFFSSHVAGDGKAISRRRRCAPRSASW